MNKISKLRLKNFIANSGANLTTALLQIITLAILTNIASTLIVSQYVVMLGFIAISEVLSDFGTRHWAIRSLSNHQSENLFQKAIRLKLFFSFITVILLSLVGLDSLNFNTTSLAILIGITQPTSDPFHWRLRAEEKMTIDACVIILNRFAVFLIINIFVYLNFSINAVALGWLCCNLIRIAGFFYKNNKEYYFPNFEMNYRNAFTSVLLIGFASTIFVIFNRAGTLFLDRTGNIIELAAFGIAFSVASSATIFINSLGNATFPALSKAYEESRYDDFNSILKTNVFWFTIVFFGGGLIGIFLADEIMLLFATEGADTFSYLKKLIPWIYLTSLSYLLRFALIASKQDQQELRLNLIGLLTLFLILWLLPRSFQVGAIVAVSYIAAEGVTSSIRIWEVTKKGLAPPSFWISLILVIPLIIGSWVLL